MFLNKHQHPVELLSLSDNANRTALMQGGGKGQVPCLRIDSKEESVQWMYESDDIIAYLKGL